MVCPWSLVIKFRALSGTLLLRRTSSWIGDCHAKGGKSLINVHGAAARALTATSRHATNIPRGAYKLEMLRCGSGRTFQVKIGKLGKNHISE